MNALTKEKSVGIMKRGDAEVHMTNFSRFRDKRHCYKLHSAYISTTSGLISTNQVVLKSPK